ncbi:TPA: antitermination protein [Enterobacter roggenkampii]|uniref:bacteriophage antitermination protein Q n=1 Tax=Enterobacter sp. CPE_E1241 TaxID=3376801 RepID=UPI0027FA22DB|nr:antitermination protein [Enterobacter roggenkampii]
MDPQLIEYARIELTYALMDNSGKTKGQLQAFCEHPPADKDRNPRKPIHVVELDNGRGGVRCVKAENSAVYVLETRSRRRPLPPINDNEFSAAPWRRAVNMLPEHEQAWLRYCYGFDLTFRYQTMICEAIWNGHQHALPPGLLKKTKKRIISLVWLAVQEVAAQQMNDTYKQYAGALLATHLGVSRSTWCEVYAPHWKMLKSAVELLDLESLSSVLVRMPEPNFEEDIG